MAQGLDLRTTREVAQRFNVDVSTVARWVRDGKLRPAFEVTGRTGARLFSHDELERFATVRAS